MARRREGSAHGKEASSLLARVGGNYGQTEGRQPDETWLPYTHGGRLGSLPSMGYARAGGVRKVRKVLKVTNIGVYATCKLLIYVNIYFIMLKIVFKFNFFT